MAAPREAEAGPGPAGARFFCTAGRGLEPFLLREVRERLAATRVSGAGPCRVADVAGPERGCPGACRDTPTLGRPDRDLDGGWSRHPPLLSWHFGHQQTVLELHSLTQIRPVPSFIQPSAAALG